MGGELITVVFVDIERSTELLVERGDDAGSATITRALSMVRSRLADYGGREVKSLGDGLMLVFSSPRQAVTFAVAVQRMVRGLEPSLRVGVNTGEAAGTDDPIGEAVTAAFRIASKAAGGEVLVSEVVRHLIGSLPGIVFTDRGRARLKGFPDRWRLFHAAGSDAGTDSVPMFGRSGEQAEVEHLLSGVVGGQGGVLIIEGEGGIGKTHLVEWARARAESLHGDVVVTRADELDPARPGRLMLELAEALAVDVGALRSGLGPDVDTAGGFVLTEAVGAVLQARSAEQPQLVIAEDLQWADELSLRGLASFSRGVQSLGIGVLLTMRPSPRPKLLGQLVDRLRDRGSPLLRLEGLDPVAVAALASAHADAPPGPRLSERLEATGGNPLLVIEMLRALDDDGQIRITGGSADVDGRDLPAGLRDVVLRRLRALSVDALDLLRLASLLGREFALRDLAVVAGQRMVDVAARIQPSVDGALLDGRGDVLTFRHDLLREAIYDDIVPAIRRDLHAAAGHALASAGAPVLQVARQLQLGAQPGDVVAIDWLERAAREALQIDVGTAATLYEQVLDLAGDAWPDRHRVQIALLEPLASAGRVADAQAVGKRLLDEPLRTLEVGAVRRALAIVAANSGDLSTAAAEAAACAHLPEIDPLEAARMRCLEASMALLLGRPGADVRAEAERTLRLVSTEEPAPVPQLCTAEQTLALVDGSDGAYEGALVHIRAARNLLVGSAVSRSGFLIPDVWEGMILLCLDDFDGSLEALAAAQVRAEHRGELALLVQTHTCRSLLHHLAGQWDDGLSELEAAQMVTEDYGNHAHDVGISALLAWRGNATADVAVAAAATVAGDEAIRHGRHLMGVDLLLHAKSRAADPATDEPLTLLNAAWRTTGHVRGFTQYGIVGPDLAKRALEAGDRTLAREVASDIERVAANTKALGAHAAAARARGIADDDLEAMLDSVAVYRESDRRVELAEACEDAGAALFAHGREDEAAGLLDEAAAVHESCGAVGERARVDALMRRHGIRRRRSRPSRATRGWEALSPTETTVVSLIAQGRTNPQIAASLFISRRTVETHVAHIFRKLDVSTRAAVAGAAGVRDHAEGRQSPTP